MPDKGRQTEKQDTHTLIKGIITVISNISPSILY